MTEYKAETLILAEAVVRTTNGEISSAKEMADFLKNKNFFISNQLITAFGRTAIQFFGNNEATKMAIKEIYNLYYNNNNSNKINCICKTCQCEVEFTEANRTVNNSRLEEQIELRGDKSFLFKFQATCKNCGIIYIEEKIGNIKKK